MTYQSDQMDLLTGLPNITYFRSLSQKILNDKVAREKGLAFIYFNISNFRAFNYYYGLDAGDKYLIKVGNVIQQNFPELYVSRFSDDHFAVVAYDIDIEKRIARIREQVLIKNMSKSMTIKAGIYLVPKDDSFRNCVRAYDNAKLACESINKLVKVNECYYNEELGRQDKLREHIIETIDLAIKNEYIKVFYQPIIHVMSGRLYGYECLARWIDPEFGFLSPADFIKTLEDARLIHRLDSYMINKICYDMKNYKANGLNVVPLSVNLSVHDFQVADMPMIAHKAIKKNGLPHDMLNIEITETAMGSDYADIHDVLERFRSIGFEIWMDNFGSKYSSLNILEDVDIDLLKVDMKFLKNFHTSSRSRTILKNIMNMAKELGIRTLMEGVEDEEVLEFLRQVGCEKAQGYLFGKPAPLTEETHTKLNPETMNVRHYYNSIGKVNLLSQTPLKSSQDLNGIPLAIVEFNGRYFKFLMSNPNFCKIFETLGVDGKNSPEDVFNNTMLQFAIQVAHTAKMCINNDKEFVQDFVTSEGFHNLRLRKIAHNEESDATAILLVVEQITGNLTLQRRNRQELALKFLYSLYSRVDLIKLDGAIIENIYLNSSRYYEGFVQNDISSSIKNFAENNIYVEDRAKFVEFYNPDTIHERVQAVGDNHIVDYFRTHDENNTYSWLMYMIVPVIIKGEKYILSCTRGIDAERMRRLPEIDKMGMEYYDMPGNPIFLLLAARAFASTFGYGSFEQFLKNSLYVEANLSTNSILYIHLGNNQSENEIHRYQSMSWNDFALEMLSSMVIENYNRGIKKFFNRKRLLENYAEAITNDEAEFLRKINDKEEYFHAVYQLRESNETGDIHAFFLLFNVDNYRRTTEHMIMLIERDALTELYNRGTAVNKIHDYLSTSVCNNALIILDLDNFKQINDRFGHDCGDMILREAAKRMNNSFGKNGIVARIGGDEFLVFLKDINLNEVDLWIHNFSSSIKEIEYHGQNLTFTMSIGYAIYPDHGTEYHTLYQNADMALYTVKMAGRANYRVYSPTMINNNRKQLGFSLNQLSEGMPGGFLVYRADDSNEILYANKRVVDMYECKSLEEFRAFTGNSFKGCVHSEDWHIIQGVINKQKQNSDGYDCVQYRAKTFKGNIRMIEDFGRLVQSPDDGDMFYIFMIDLEQKKNLYLPQN